MRAPACEEALLVVEGERVWRGELNRSEAIADLIGNHDGAVINAGQRAQMRAQTHELRGTMRERGGRVGLGGFQVLGTKIGGDGVDDAEGDVVPAQGDGELVGDDVVLGLEILGLDGDDSG